MSCCYGLWAEWLHSHYTIELLHRWFIVMVKKEGCTFMLFFSVRIEYQFFLSGFFLSVTPINWQSGSMILDRLVRSDQQNILWFINETMGILKQFIWRNVVWKRIYWVVLTYFISPGLCYDGNYNILMEVWNKSKIMTNLH